MQLETFKSDPQYFYVNKALTYKTLTRRWRQNFTNNQLFTNQVLLVTHLSKSLSTPCENLPRR